jgi:UDP-glucose:glycoprotein glucosyltransferase
VTHAFVTEAKYDLDNIKLDDLPAKERVLYAQFQLQHVLVEGNCYDWTEFPYRPPTPPRGLELVLGTPKHPTIKDTIVMSNFGYFQLKVCDALLVV